MTTYLDIKDSAIYSVGAAASVLEVSRNTIWRWTNEGLLKPISITAARKKYTGKALKHCWMRM